MPDKSGVGDALAQRLQTMGVEVLRLNETLDADALKNLLESWMAAGPVHGVYWLPALDNEGSLSEMDLATWHGALQTRVKSLYATMRILYEQVAAPGTFLVSATRLGGQHGYDEAGATAPLGWRRRGLHQSVQARAAWTRWSKRSTLKRNESPQRSPTS